MAENNNCKLLQLNEEDFIAKGSHNLVYRHPTNPDYLVKVLGVVKVLGLIKNLKTVKGLDQRFLNSKWIGNTKLIRKFNQFRLIKAHVREFIELVRVRFNDEFLLQPPPFLQRTVGFVDTNLGFAMVVEAEKDKNGQYASTLTTLIKTHQTNEQLYVQLEDFCKQLLTYDLSISDLDPDNIVYAYDGQQGGHFVLIDGYGDKTFIPLLRFSHYFRTKATLRHISQLKRRIARLEIKAHSEKLKQNENKQSLCA